MARITAVLLGAMLVSMPAFAQDTSQPAAKDTKAPARTAKKQEFALPDTPLPKSQTSHPRTVTLTAKNPPETQPPTEEAATEPETKPEEQPPDPQLELLRKQIEQQTQLIQLLQQQLEGQQEQTARLQALNQQLQTVQQQLAAGQEQQTERLANQQAEVANLDSIIGNLRAADQALLQGDGSVNLSALVDQMPGEARGYLEQAQTSLANGDFYTARSFLELSISIAERARVQATGIVPESQ